MKKLRIHKLIASAILVVGLTGCGSKTPDITPKEEITEKTLENEETEINAEEKETENRGSNLGDVFSTSESLEDESQFVTYIENGVAKIKEALNGETATHIKESAKQAGTKLGDFIFNDGEIAGKTWDDLSSSAKTKVLEVATSLDEKIVKYAPDYKEKMKDWYQNASSKTKAVLQDIIGEDNYNYFSGKVSDLKDKLKDTKDKIYEKGKELWNNRK